MVVVVFRTDDEWDKKMADKVEEGIKKLLGADETMDYFNWFWTSCPDGEGCEGSVVDFMEETMSDLQ